VRQLAIALAFNGAQEASVLNAFDDRFWNLDQAKTYPLRIERHDADGGFLAFFPDLPRCQTWDESYEETVRSAEEALTLYVETLVAVGDMRPQAPG
jgi:predicted RNase H-like HicB family nuclease